jgi:GNAT superfamily N-acetyltransferase
MSRTPAFRIRRYRESDADAVGRVIADTYGEYNLSNMAPDTRASMLGPFAFTRSEIPEHQREIAAAISAPSVWVAEQGNEIVGALRGGRGARRGRTVLSSLFVARRHHRRGIGRGLVERFERECSAKGVEILKLAATLYAVPFYLSVGYKKTTGVRSTKSFGEPGLRYQPMKKVLR